MRRCRHDIVPGTAPLEPLVEVQLPCRLKVGPRSLAGDRRACSSVLTSHEFRAAPPLRILNALEQPPCLSITAAVVYLQFSRVFLLGDGPWVPGQLLA